MERQLKVLFLTQPAVGHLNTLLSIASQMKADGHTVHFLLPGARGPKTNFQVLDTVLMLPDILRQNDIPFDLIPLEFSMLWGGILWPFKSGYAEFTHAVEIFSQGIAHYTRHILKFVEQSPPDVLVTDFALVAAGLAAEIADIPYAVVYHSGLPFRGEGIPPFGSGLPIGPAAATHPLAQEYARQESLVLDKLDRRVAQVRRKFNLPPVAPDLLRRPYSPWLNLVTSVEAAEAPRNNLTSNTVFVGPCFGRRANTQADFPFDKLRDAAFKVYVSLGTVFNNKPKVFQKIIRALDVPEYQVILSAGSARPVLQRMALPRNVMLFKSVPQVAVLPKVDLFISHGGNNSVNEALAAGKPLIVMPVAGEQADNASRIEYLNVGRRMDIAQFESAHLLSLVEEIRATPAFHERNLAIARAIAATQSLPSASQCIAWVGRNRRPLQRTGGVPLTITPDVWPQLFV
ncbi:MAG: hypothetical protein JXA21_30230 [Anaerolineae bacterium]|nr:hypothetical protein [Anaerolineae bacterium]